MPRLLLAGLAIAVASQRAQGQVIHELTPTSVLEVRGDTVHWMRTLPSQKVDTNVFVIRRDSTVRLLRPGPARELPAPVAKYFRLILENAVENEALREKLRQVKP